MSRRELMACAIFLILMSAPLAFGALGYTKVSANSVAQTASVSGYSLLIVNDGSNEVYVNVYDMGQTVVDATTASAEIKSGESVTFERPGGLGGVSIICAAGETATVRLLYW